MKHLIKATVYLDGTVNGKFHLRLGCYGATNSLGQVRVMRSKVCKLCLKRRKQNTRAQGIY